MHYRRIFFIGCLFALFIAEGFVSERSSPPKNIQVDAKPFNNFDLENAQKRTFGALQFRGGLVLSSSDADFGGISALRVQNDGEHFIALTDRAYWLRGRIVYDGQKPIGLADTEMAPITGPDGNHAVAWDTESIAQDGSGLYVGVEGLREIPCFVTEGSKFPVYRNSISFPIGVQELPRNGGLEALEFIPAKNASGNILVAFSEKGLDKNGNLVAFVIEGSKSRIFAVKRSEQYDISDAVLLPDDYILILERKYDVINGVSVRIRKISVNSIKQDALVDGSVVLEADMRYQVDNMECISVHRDTSGKTVLTLMSDDNFMPIQRNLLLQFTLTEE